MTDTSLTKFLNNNKMYNKKRLEKRIFKTFYFIYFLAVIKQVRPYSRKHFLVKLGGVEQVCGHQRVIEERVKGNVQVTLSNGFDNNIAVHHMAYCQTVYLFVKISRRYGLNGIFTDKGVCVDYRAVGEVLHLTCIFHADVGYEVAETH